MSRQILKLHKSAKFAKMQIFFWKQGSRDFLVFFDFLLIIFLLVFFSNILGRCFFIGWDGWMQTENVWNRDYGDTPLSCSKWLRAEFKTATVMTRSVTYVYEVCTLITRCQLDEYQYLHWTIMQIGNLKNVIIPETKFYFLFSSSSSTLFHSFINKYQEVKDL